jgi:thiol-disulfide isomerase/thioredoxin
MAQSKGGQKAKRAKARRKAARRKQLTWWGLIGGAVLAVVIGVAAMGGSGPASTGVADPVAWDLPSLDGEGRVALADFQGKPTVAAFFASWCPHCRRELPGFAGLSEELGSQVNFVGINTMDRGGGHSFAGQVGIDSWPLAADIGNGDRRDLVAAFGAQGMPATVIYDAAGHVADVRLGVVNAEQLRSLLAELFDVG